jgi:thiol-disulfide isomerase/thioredoxin
MFVRWTIATLGGAALAALTVTAQMPWLTQPHPAMEVRQSQSPGGEGSSPAEPRLSCPADAKPANLNFTLKDAGNREISLAQYKGKVIVLDFWATWCGPCKVEIPHFVEFQEKYGKAGLQIVGISVDDTADKLQDAYGPIVGIPVSVVISRDGKICATHTGLTGKDVFEREIKSLL